MILITYQKKKFFEQNDKPISQTQNIDKEGWKRKKIYLI